MPADFGNRISAAARAAADAGAPALLITNPANVLYLSGFGGTSARVLVAGGRLYFMTDFRYSRSVARLVSSWPPGSQVIEIKGSYDEALEQVVRDAAVGRVAFEAAHVTVSQHGHWSRRLVGVTLVATERIVESLRAIKDAAELETMRDAGRRISGIASSLRDWARGGRSEREIAADVNYAMARAGFSRPAFETIVASGPNAALPHARPGDRRLTTRDLVVVDFGGVLDGYAVDITRTLSVGRPSEASIRLHAAVVAAQGAAIETLRPGARVQDVDNAARRALEAHGFGGAIRHATGHGLGIEVHEEPRLSRDAHQGSAPLAAGMVVTIEPGAYPDGTGVRIEDDLVVADGGPEWLTDAPRELVVTE